MGVQIAKVACLRNGSDTNLNPLEPIMKTTTVIARHLTAQIEVAFAFFFPPFYTFERNSLRVEALKRN